MSHEHFVSASAGGPCAICGERSTHKVGEEIPHDDPFQMRHNLTAYVCCRHFRKLLGPATGCPCDDDEPTTEAWLLKNGWHVRQHSFDSEKQALALYVDEDRWLEMHGLKDSLPLVALDRQTFEHTHLFSFAPIPTRGHARRMYWLLGLSPTGGVK